MSTTAPRVTASRAADALTDSYFQMFPDETALLLERLEPDETARVLERSPLRRGVPGIERLTPDAAARAVERMSPVAAVQILSALDPSRSAELLSRLDADTRGPLLNGLHPGKSKELIMLMSYPPDTAGSLCDPRPVTFRPEVTVREALARLRGLSGRRIEDIYLVDEQGQLVGSITLQDLVRADLKARLEGIAGPAPVSVPARATRAELVDLLQKRELNAVAVVDVDNHLVGSIHEEALFTAMQEEAAADIERLGGMEALDAPYLHVGFPSLVRKRGGWLSVLFVGEMLTATAMGYYEEEISRAVVLALFVPLIISSGGNSGSQAASIMIRSLALQELRLRDWFRVFRRELLSGCALGALLGTLGFLRIVLWQRLHLADYGPHYLLIAATVWTSLVGVIVFGTLAGSMLPFIMRRLGFDPATSSAPFVATLVDVTGLVIYFTVAVMILRGTLL